MLWILYLGISMEKINKINKIWDSEVCGILCSPLVESARDGIVIIQKGKYCYANEAWSEITGYTPEELSKMTILDVVDPQYKNIVQKRYNSRESGEDPPAMYNIDIICKDKSKKTIELSAVQMEFDNKPAVMAILRDVTERIESEKELKSLSGHFCNIINSMSEYLYFIQYRNGIVDAVYHSPRCSDVTGYTLEEYNSDTDLWMKMIHEEDRERVVGFFEEIRQKMDRQSIEHRIIHKDGSLRWVSNTYSVRKQGEFVYESGIVLDITSRKRTEQELHESESRYRELFNSMSNGVAVYEVKDGGKIFFFWI